MTKVMNFKYDRGRNSNKFVIVRDDGFRRNSSNVKLFDISDECAKAIRVDEGMGYEFPGPAVIQTMRRAIKEFDLNKRVYGAWRRASINALSEGYQAMMEVEMRMARKSTDIFNKFSTKSGSTPKIEYFFPINFKGQWKEYRIDAMEIKREYSFKGVL